MTRAIARDLRRAEAAARKAAVAALAAPDCDEASVPSSAANGPGGPVPASDAEMLAALRKDYRRVGECFLRSRKQLRRLEAKNMDLHLRLIRLRRASGIWGV